MKKNMLRLLVLTAAIVGFSFSSQADVLIYNLTLTNRVMGGGSNSVVIARGKLLRDIDTGENALLFRYNLNGGNFYELHCTGFTLKQVVVPGGTNTVLTSIGGVQSPIDPNATVGVRIFYARGTDEPIELRRFRTELAARVLRGLQREIVDGDDGTTFLVESAVTATLNSTLTRDSNTRGASVPLLVLEQRQVWEDAGFVLVVDDCNP